MRDFCGGSFQATNKNFLTSIKFFLFFIFYHRLILSSHYLFHLKTLIF